jgi:hypothetical protein
MLLEHRVLFSGGIESSQAQELTVGMEVTD